MSDEFRFDRDKLSNELLKAYTEDGDGEGKSGFFSYIVVATIAGVIGFFAYALLKDGVAISSNDIQNIPLVKADKTPIRVIPEDPGGMNIPNRDKFVYENAVAPEKRTLPKVTRILPPPEEPMKREEIATLKQDMVEVVEESSAKEDEGPLEEIVEMKEITTEDIVAVNTANTKKIPIPVKRKVATSAKAWRVQLGAFKTPSEVDKNWQKISKKYSQILSGLSHESQKADLGKKGVFFRLQAGSFEDKADAMSICQKLTDQKQGCFVVKR